MDFLDAFAVATAALGNVVVVESIFDAAMSAGRISVIEIRVDLETITTRATLDKIRGSGAK